MTGFKALRTAIIAKINDTLEEIDIDERLIYEALWSPADIVKLPSVIILPEELESGYENTAGGRRRIYVFRGYILEELKSGRKQSEIEQELSDCIDFLIELFDKKQSLTVEGLLHVRPTPSVWGDVTYGGGQARFASLTIACEVIVDST
jgi:hypothetical protein